MPKLSLSDARLYLCTDGRRRQGDLEEFLDAVLAGGVDIVQLRDKGMEAAEELEHLQVFADACARHGKLLAVNDRADVAHAVVWPAEAMQTVENRRHWHSVCWAARDRRRPGGSFA